MAELKVGIEGMSCQHCVMAVKKAVDALQGVEGAEVVIGSAEVKFNASLLKPEQIKAAIVSAGYTVKQ